jgi:hypothetical protein
MARFVLPQAEGEGGRDVVPLLARHLQLEDEHVLAIQPWSRAMVLAMRRAKHFLPRSALPP